MGTLSAICRDYVEDRIAAKMIFISAAKKENVDIKLVLIIKEFFTFFSFT